MSKIARMMQQATAGAGGAGLDVDEVFRTYLYDGTSSSLTINNGIDLSGEGGLTWIKARNFGSSNHALFDTARGGGSYLQANETLAQETPGSAPLTFNSNGFTINTQADSWNGTYYNNEYVSWTWRKAKKFFDIVTYTGNGSARTISHNLGSVPGMIIIKSTTSQEDWVVYHRSLGGGYYSKLQDTAQFLGVNTSVFNGTDATDSVFSVGNSSKSNGSGQTYVAYVFAHNNNDGGFGPNADQDIIKCGSYTGNDNTSSINLGFEAQWLLIKNASSAANWELFDVMRGMAVGTNGVAATLKTNQNNAEYVYPSNAGIYPTANGFDIDSSQSNFNGAGYTYIYMAIRRGSLTSPTLGTQVFAADLGDTSSVPQFVSNFPVDMAILRDINGSDSAQVSSRLTGTAYMTANSNGSENNNSYYEWDFHTGYFSTALNTDYFAWMWKRAPGYFDVVCYDGSNSNSTINHNLGVAPEMIWVKRRDVSSGHWRVFIPSLSGILKLNGTDALDTSNAKYYFGDNNNIIAPTATQFTVTPQTGNVNTNSSRYVAYLFATLAGVSKVGSYTGNGSAQNIDCGFSNGARFVLIKNSSLTSNWVLVDSVRGLVSGNDKWLALESTASQYTYDLIDPYSSGFALAAGETNVNTTGSTYIFYAIA